MSALRPLLRALPRRTRNPSFARMMSSQTPAIRATTVPIARLVQNQAPKKTEASAMVVKTGARMPREKLQLMVAAMPQLVPFYFVNEVLFAYIALPTIIYVLSKYVLPQKVRLFMARLFISKL